MSPFRPDLVDCWMFRIGRTARSVARPEILLIRRAPERSLPGLWQCVSGSLEEGERVAAGALRELAEETGFGAAEIEGFYDLQRHGRRLRRPSSSGHRAPPLRRT